MPNIATTDPELLPFYAWQLAAHFTPSELRTILHDAEIELAAATTLGEDDAGFWESLIEVYQAGLSYRMQTDAKRAARLARSIYAKRVPQIDYAEIKARVDIVEYIGRYVELRKRGSHYVGLCPLHSEKTPSFMVWPQIKGWRCFGCGKHGDVVTFARFMGERLE